MNSSGLTTAEAELKLRKYGVNDVSERKTGLVKKFLAPLYAPIALMLLGAAFLSWLNGRTFDFSLILVLYAINYSVQKWQEFKADRAIQELRSKLSFDVSTLRDGSWVFVNARHLVPGDRIRLGLGSIVPADGSILSAKNLAMNEAVLTGESAPKEKKAGDKIYSGSFILTGSVEAQVSATGRHTFFGKTIFSVEPPAHKSILERDILHITRFLTFISLGAVAVLTTVFVSKGFPAEDLLTLGLSLVIAGIPVSLPAVMAIILSIGAAGLARKLVVVRRLSALQDLANVNMLLVDKTGTLTKNEIRVAHVISYREGASTDDVLRLAGFAVSADAPNAIDLALAKKYAEVGLRKDSSEIVRYIPYDSDRKRTTAFIEKAGERMTVSMGAPQVVRALAIFGAKEMEAKFEEDIAKAAREEYRVLAIAVRSDAHEETQLQMAGLIFLSDPLQESSKETLSFLRQNGIGVKMFTGDNKKIAERVAGELGLRGNILSAEEARAFYKNEAAPGDAAGNIAGFAEILPKDKYEIVRAFKSRFVVAATGDGINDFPALKAAHVGIAVAGAVSALKSMADIVLLGPGLAVITDAIVESRKIFARLYHYSVYRISESFRLIITILILGLWYGFYPLMPLQLILLALLNDIPIISLAVDRVAISSQPSEIKVKERFLLSLLFGSVGVINSILLFLLMTGILHLSLPVMQTIFFLKLTVSGHMLIFVAHTKERWYRFLPSKAVIFATVGTQLAATVFALTGFLMPASISFSAVVFVWLWTLFWMQMSELMKAVQARLMPE